MHRIEAAHAAHTAVDWLLHNALPWIGLGVVFGLSTAVTWRALNRIRDYITACRRISGELDQLADKRRQLATHRDAAPPTQPGCDQTALDECEAIYQMPTREGENQ